MGWYREKGGMRMMRDVGERLDHSYKAKREHGCKVRK